jgi:hypothetical protein
MARKKKKRSKNINWGQGMASFGDINATLGLVFAWIMMFGCIGFGLYLIIQGAQGKSMNSGCVTMGSSSQDCSQGFDEIECKHIQDCIWFGNTKLSGGGKAGYIVGGLFTILFGIGIVMIANWVRNKTRTDRNFAAVVGTGALVEGFASAFGGGR